MVVVLGGVELNLATGVGVAETKTSLCGLTGLQALQELVGVEADTTEEVGGDLRGLASLTIDTRRPCSSCRWSWGG
ncbi:hypothetical protein HYQ46_011548 [Verticillium longisporum]|nr:hypothetical protein HYQ46_011548 [Verticillium longisporum]